MSTIQNSQPNRFSQFAMLRMPVEVLEQGELKPAAPLQLPIAPSTAQQPISAAKQAFLDMAAGPIMNMDDFSDSNNFYDSEPEILLSDSEDEDEDPVMEGQDFEAITMVDSDSDFAGEDEEHASDNDDTSVIEEFSCSDSDSINEQINAEAAHFYRNANVAVSPFALMPRNISEVIQPNNNEL